MVELEEHHAWWRSRGRTGLRQLLIDGWDPARVGSTASARRAYDGYAGEVVALLRVGAGPDMVAQYLSEAEERMDRPTRPAELMGIAGQIVDWYAAEMRMRTPR